MTRSYPFLLLMATVALLMIARRKSRAAKPGTLVDWRPWISDDEPFMTFTDPRGIHWYDEP